MSDPHFASVVLLAVNEDGANGSTIFVDQSTVARTLTAVGNAAWSNAQAATAWATSQSSDGNGDGVQAAASADFNIAGTTAKTIEIWVRHNGAFSGQEGILWYGGTTLGWSDTTGNAWVFFVSGGAPKFQHHRAGNSFTTAITGSAISADTWAHIAITYDGTTLTLWQDGVSKGTNTETIATTSSPALLSTGWDRPGTTTTAWKGWIEGVRITNAIRYTGPFTPPVGPYPTSAIDPPVADTGGGGMSPEYEKQARLYEDDETVLSLIKEFVENEGFRHA